MRISIVGRITEQLGRNELTSDVVVICDFCLRRSVTTPVVSCRVVSMEAVTETDAPETAGRSDDNTRQNGGKILQVECGLNKAVLHLDRLCQGSKGACILFEETWMTPNEFQAASGRETAKDWKRSIKHHDKSLKLLIVKGFLFVDPPVCKCEYCFSDSPTAAPPSHLRDKVRNYLKMTCPFLQ